MYFIKAPSCFLQFNFNAAAIYSLTMKATSLREIAKKTNKTSSTIAMDILIYKLQNKSKSQNNAKYSYDINYAANLVIDASKLIQ